jgi:hypothetical protein
LTTAIKASLCLSAAAALLACVACSGPGNTGRTTPGTELVPDAPGNPASAMVPLEHKVPWVNGGVPELDANHNLVTTLTPYYPPLPPSTPDRDGLTKAVLLNGDDAMVTTAPIDCSVLAPYEFAPWVATSEPDEVNAQAIGGPPAPLLSLGEAVRWAGADDHSRGSWRVPGGAAWYKGLDPKDQTFIFNYPLPWGTPAEQVPQGTVVPACDGKPNNWVIHMRGAGFRYYGGNIAHILAGENFVATAAVPPATVIRNPTPDAIPTCPPGSDLCAPISDPHAPGAGTAVNSAGFPLGKGVDAAGEVIPWTQPVLHTYWDVSAYEGVSFWARRGPDSMGTLFVTLQDQHTSDDMNRENNKFCKRILPCVNTCLNGEPCSPNGDEKSNGPNNDHAGPTVYRCFDPKKGAIPQPPPFQTAVTVADVQTAPDDELDVAYPRCGPSACTFRADYPDPDFEGKECRPHTFTSGESGNYCFNAGDPLPPSREERCGDGYSSTIQLSTEWQFYTVPFSDMRQGGYGKISPEFDLHSAYSITLAWYTGNLDFFIDNVSLYRTPGYKPKSP